MKTLLNRVLLTSTFLAGYPMAALAQDSATTVSDDFQLEDIVVTARRREENLQDTPISITAFSGKTLEAMNIREVSKVAQFTPGLELVANSQSSGVAVTLRGIASGEPLLTSDPAVGIYIDGVYVNSLSYGQFDTLDLERIEVLRGPQGTLFGRNTTGGAINITTRKPAQDFGVEGRVSYASYNDVLTNARLDTGEIIPGWRGSLTYQYRRADGYVDDITRPSSRDPGALNGHAGRAALHGDVGNLSVDYGYDFVRRRNVVPVTQFLIVSDIYRSLFQQSQSNGGDPLRYSTTRLGVINSADEPMARTRNNNHTMTLAYEISPTLTVKSITGQRQYSGSEINPFGSSSGLIVPVLGATGVALQSVNPFIGGGTRHLKQFSEEVQILGSTGRLKYTLGGFYFNASYHEESPQNYVAAASVGGAAIGVPQSSQLQYEGTTRSYALFGQASYTPSILNEGLEITAGLRHTIDEKSLDTRLIRPLKPTVESERQDTFKDTSYNITLNYKLMEDVSVYGRYGTGYRAGGFTPRTLTLPAYRPEKAKVAEFGLKSEWFNRRLRANLSIFHTDYRDFQAAQPAFDSASGTFVVNIVNAGKVVYKGMEFQFSAVPVKGLTLTGDLAYIDPKYKEYLYFGNDIKDIAQFLLLSKFSFHVGSRYEFPALSFGKLAASLDYSYKSRRYFSTITSDPVGLPNALERASGPPQNDLSGRITLSDLAMGRTTLELSVFGENLLDRRYLVHSIDFGALGFATGQFNRPRVIGGEARFKF